MNIAEYEKSHAWSWAKCGEYNIVLVVNKLAEIHRMLEVKHFWNKFISFQLSDSQSLKTLAHLDGWHEFPFWDAELVACWGSKCRHFLWHVNRSHRIQGWVSLITLTVLWCSVKGPFGCWSQTEFRAVQSPQDGKNTAEKM